MLQPLTKKIFLEIEPPGNGDNLADKDRITWWLQEKHSLAVKIPYLLFNKIYPLCREADWKVTVTLGYIGGNWQLINIEKGDTHDRNFGLAVDLGSTTVVMQLLDLNHGVTVAEQSMLNKQISYGEDILSRIFYAQGKGNELGEVQRSTIETLKELISILIEKAKIERDDLGMMVVAGNTTMIHFLLGLNPWTVFHHPFAPIFNEVGFLSAQELGLPLNPNTLIYCIPSIANYLGGDIVSGLLVSGIYKQDQASIFIDIGTNGEIVIGDKKQLWAGAGAAGPALEGGVVKTGMRAVGGAVDRVKINSNEIELGVIGGGKPEGICGSGIVDMIAQLFLNGLIDFAGKFIPDKSARIVQRDKQNVFVYAWPEESALGKELVFTQVDIDQFMETKAAAHTMVTYLLSHIDMDLSKIDRFYTAGAFGTYLSLESAITIGLYPDLPREKFVSLGNSSLAGARALLLDRDLFKDIKLIKEKISYLEFGAATDYLTRMFAARFLPHTDLNLYPTVKKQLQQRGLLSEFLAGV